MAHRAKTSLQTRLILIVVGVLIVSLWSLAFLIDRSQRERLADLLIGQQDATVAYIAEDIESKVTFRIRGLEKLTERFPIEALERTEALQAYLADRRSIYNLFELGLIVVKPDLSGAFGDYPPLPGRRETPFRISPFKEVVDTGLPAIGPPRMGRFSSRPVVVIGVPIKDAEGRLRGVLAGVTTIDSANFLDLITRPRESTRGEYFVADPKHGMIIAGTRPELILKKLPDKGQDELLDSYFAGGEGSGIGQSATGEKELMSARRVPSSGWVVIARLAARDAYAPVNELRMLVFGGSALLSILVGIAAALYVRRALRPLRFAARAFDDISKGRVPLHSLPVSGHDEISQVVESFNRLQAQLSAETRALSASEARYRRFIDESPLGVLIVQDGIIKYANASLAHLLEYELRSLFGAPVLNHIAPEDRDRAAEVHKRRMAGEPAPESLEYRMVNARGEVRYCRLAVRTMEWEGRLAAHAVVTDLTEVRQAEQKLQQIAHFDALTGVPNRLLLGDRLRLALVQTTRARTLMAVCYLDLDDFKPINDTWGHEVGDRLLVEMAGRLQRCLRGGDTVARLGGDEFVLLLLGLERVEECESALQRVLQAVAAPVVVDDQVLMVSASIGVAVYPFDSDEPDALLRNADHAMYQAKQAGRNRYCFYESLAGHSRPSTENGVAMQ